MLRRRRKSLRLKVAREIQKLLNELKRHEGRP